MSSFIRRMMLDDLEEARRQNLKGFRVMRIKWAYGVIAPRVVRATLALLAKGASPEHIERALQNDKAAELAAYAEITAGHVKEHAQNLANPCVKVNGCMHPRSERRERTR